MTRAEEAGPSPEKLRADLTRGKASTGKQHLAGAYRLLSIVYR